MPRHVALPLLALLALLAAGSASGSTLDDAAKACAAIEERRVKFFLAAAEAVDDARNAAGVIETINQAYAFYGRTFLEWKDAFYDFAGKDDAAADRLEERLAGTRKRRLAAVRRLADAVNRADKRLDCARETDRPFSRLVSLYEKPDDNALDAVRAIGAEYAAFEELLGKAYDRAAGALARARDADGIVAAFKAFGKEIRGIADKVPRSVRRTHWLTDSQRALFSETIAGAQQAHNHAQEGFYRAAITRPYDFPEDLEDMEAAYFGLRPAMDDVNCWTYTPAEAAGTAWFHFRQGFFWRVARAALALDQAKKGKHAVAALERLRDGIAATSKVFERAQRDIGAGDRATARREAFAKVEDLTKVYDRLRAKVNDTRALFPEQAARLDELAAALERDVARYGIKADVDGAALDPKEETALREAYRALLTELTASLDQVVPDVRKAASVAALAKLIDRFAESMSSSMVAFRMNTGSRKLGAGAEDRIFRGLAAETERFVAAAGALAAAVAERSKTLPGDPGPIQAALKRWAAAMESFKH